MENLNKIYEYKYWHPAVTTDAVIFGYDAEEMDLSVLLIKRGEPKPGDEPAYVGYWALPGGFLHENEPAEKCVLRELREETYMRLFDNEKGISPDFIEQLHTFSEEFSKEDNIGRDPREYVMTVAFYALVKKKDYYIKGGDDAAEAKWYSIKQLPENLAFDHAKIINMAIDCLRTKIHFSPIGFRLLDKTFTLAQLKNVYEIILGTTLDRGNFRKKMLQLQYIKPTGKKDFGHQHRAADFYEFNEEAYNNSKKFNLNLEF